MVYKSFVKIMKPWRPDLVGKSVSQFKTFIAFVIVVAYFNGLVKQTFSLPHRTYKFFFYYYYFFILIFHLQSYNFTFTK